LKQQIQTKQVDGIGPVVLRRNRRARRLILQVRPGQPVTITIPFLVSVKSALAFLEANRDWILKKLHTLKNHQPIPVVIDGKHPVQTRTHRLELQPVAAAIIKVTVRSDTISVHYPAEHCVTDPRIQEGIAQGLTAAYRIEAQQFLPARLQALAERYGFRYNRVTIKNLKSRWGSCSGLNNINLNLHLMRLPDELIDYVILHELMHTRIGNHGPVFWAELVKILPSVKILRNQLKTYAQRGFLDSVLVGH